MQSARAIHRAAQAALGSRFVEGWWERLPYSALHPAFLAAVRKHTAWPSPAQYDELARTVPQPTGVVLPRFVAQSREALAEVGGYEPHVAKLRTVPTRPQSWHDLFNMAVWAHFPRVRWALNALHVDDQVGPKDPRNGRAPAQNVAAQLDESGIVVASSSPSLLTDLRALRFKHVFWERRAELATTTRFWVIGHGTLESLLTPHLGLASKAVLLELPQAPALYDADALRHDLDARVAAHIATWRSHVPVLDPVPLLGIPGYADNADASFYDNAQYFRFQRRDARRA